MDSPTPLSYNHDSVCMLCKATPSDNDILLCTTCFTVWHASCIGITSQEIHATVGYKWKCPDCNPDTVVSHHSSNSVTNTHAIRKDPSLTMDQKQDLVSSNGCDRQGKTKCRDCNTDTVGTVSYHSSAHSSDSVTNTRVITEDPSLTVDQKQDLVSNGGSNSKGKSKIMEEDEESVDSDITPQVSYDEYSISSKAKAIKEMKGCKLENPKTIAERPDAAFVTERARKGGLANASSGRIFVTVPRDHFGPIMAENDPERNRGVLVGDNWNSRMEARQWGVHLAPISGISGQSKTGAQSVVLSGGYEDDVDHGAWFIYTGSGGRDLSGNKRTNKVQSSDQDFVKCNEALRVSCKEGYPVRVVRAYKYDKSIYAPLTGYRYDGIYRIERCWRIVGMQGFLVCRYLFVRCDNQPAPWTSDMQGDLPRASLPYIPGFNEGVDICERDESESPSWDFDEVELCWKWRKPPPRSKTVITRGNTKNTERRRKERIRKLIFHLKRLQ